MPNALLFRGHILPKAVVLPFKATCLLLGKMDKGANAIPKHRG